MSKKKIEKALAAKGLKAKFLQYDRSIPTPEEFVSGWIVELDEDSEDKLMSLEGDFGLDYMDKGSNVAEVLEWVDSLPDCSEVEI